MNKEIRTRFAPSPTGFLHIGGLRTALYDYLIAKNGGGKFILRIEDTDRARLVDGAIEKVLEALKWVGIEPDEGVVSVDGGKISQKGESGPYIQSERLDIYREHIETLLEKGHAYYCFCSPDRLNELRTEQQKRKEAPKYDKHCINLPKNEVEKKILAGERYTIRLNVPFGEMIEFNDLVYGKISVKSETIDDQILIKSDGYPTYHFAVVVDDHLMRISHITRGEEWLPSTPKHILLYKYFGWETPEFIHFPSVQGENRKKLSKREGDVSVDDFIKKGYLPEAIVNFITLLGWNPKSEREHFSLEELEKIFNVAGLHKSGAIFDYKKLDWMNGHYIKQKNDAELFVLVEPLLKKYCEENDYETEDDLLKKVVRIEKERMKKITDITENVSFYFTQADYDSELLRWKDNTDEQTLEALKKAKGIIGEIEEVDFNIEKIEKLLMDAAGEKRGDLLWPLRASLTGEKKSPSPFEMAWALGKKESLKRIEKAIIKIS